MVHLHKSRPSFLIVAAVLAGAAASCGDAAPPQDGARVAITAAPLRLPGLSDVEYTLTVRNQAGDTVWTKAVSSSRYGDGAGAFSYVGTCDAGSNPNAVQLDITRLVDSDGQTVAPETYRNPSPVLQSVTCRENADTPVLFDLTVVRAARQGFFDVAVEFDDIFCSAKLDCQDAFLHQADGQRGPSAVLGFACTSGDASPTWLYFADDVALTCGDRTYFVDPTGGPGNLGADAPALFQTAAYRGREAFSGVEKCYWNVAFGLDPSEAPCTLTARATATSTPFVGGLTPAGAVRPEIVWDAVPISPSGATLSCGAHPLDGPGSLVHSAYIPATGAAYRHELACATMAVSTAPGVACGLEGGPCELADPCARGTCQAGACVATGQLPDGSECTLEGACDPLSGCVTACASGVCEGAQPSQPLGAASLPAGSPITGAADDARGLAYLARGADGVAALDVSDPDAPTPRGSWTESGLACVEVVVYEAGANVYVFAACGAAGVKVLDFTDPDAPALLATLAQPAPATTLALLGPWLYVGDGADLRIYDATDPASPIAFTAFTAATGGATVFRLGAWGDRVYALLSTGAVVVIDATTRGALTALHTWTGYASPTAFAVERGVVYVAYAGAGFYIVDFLDATAPVVLYHDGGSFIVHLAVFGRYAVLVYADGRYVTLGLRLLSRPKVLTSSFAAATVTGVAVFRAGVAFAAYGADYALLDFLPFLVASSPPEASVGLYGGDPIDLRFSEPLDPASVTAASVVLSGVTGALTQPAPDTLRWTQASPLDPAAYAAVVASVADLRGSPGPLVPDRATFTVDATYITSPELPLTLLGAAPGRFSWSVPGATATDSYLLVSTDVQGTSPYYPHDRVAGVATPGGDGGFEAWWTPPAVTVDTTFWVVVVVVVDGVTYYGQVLPVVVAVNPDGCAGDACPPAAGTILDEQPRDTLTGAVVDAVEVGDLVYVAVGVGGLEIRDQSDPTDVRLVGAWVDASAGLDCAGLVHVGDVVYLACGAAGVKLVDVSDPAAPFTLGTIAHDGTVSGSATTVATLGHALYVGIGLRVAVYDIGDPLAPLFVGWAGGASGVGPDVIVRVVVDGAALYAFFAEGTLIVFDLSVDVLAPVYVRVVAPLAGGLIATDLAVVDGLGYLGFLGGGLYIVDLRAVLVSGPWTWVILWHDGGSQLLRVSVYGRLFACLYADGQVLVSTATIPTAPWVLSRTPGGGLATGLRLLSRWVLVGAGLVLRVVDVPPHVYASSHRDGTRGACPDVPVDLWFSSPIDGATITASTVDVAHLTGSRTTSDARVRFAPSAAFSAGKKDVRVAQPDITNVRATAGPTRGYAASFEVAAVCGEWTTTPDAALAGTPISLGWSVDGATPDATFVHLSTWPDPADGFAVTTTVTGVAVGGGAYTAVWDVPVGTTSPTWYAVVEVRVGHTTYWSPITRVDVGLALSHGVGLAGDTLLDAVDDGPYAYVAVGVGLEVHDVTDPANAVVLGRWTDPGLGTCKAVAAAAPYVYLACGATGVHVIDVSDPAHPTRVYVIDQVGAFTLTLYGDALYVGFGEDIAIWNVADPRGPVYVRTIVTGAGSALVRVTVADGVLYALFLDGVVRTWELFGVGVRFDPVFLKLVVSLYPGSPGVDLVVLDGVAYLAYGGGVGLVAIDVTGIRLGGWIAVALWVYGPPDAGADIVRIHVRGGLVSLVYTTGRLVIGGLRPGLVFVVLSSTLRVGAPTAVHIFASGYVFAAYGRAWSYVDPPLYLVASVPAEGGATCGDADLTLLFSAPVRDKSVNARSLRVETGGAPVAGSWSVDGPLLRFAPAAALSNGAYTVRIADTLENARGTGAIAATVGFDVGAACVAITGSPGRVLGGTSASFAWTVTGGSPTSQRLLLSTSPSPAGAPMAEVSGASPAAWTTPDVAVPTTWYAQVEAVVGGSTARSQVVSFVVEPTLGGFTAGPGESILAVVEGEGALAYVALGLGVAIRDVSDPDRPLELGRWVYGGTETCDAVAIHGTTIYLSCGAGGIQIIDASDPLAPVYVGLVAVDAGNLAVSLVVVGDALYIGLADGSVRVYDLTVAFTPVYQTVLVGPGAGLVRLWVDGLRLYALYVDGAVGVYGLADLYAPAFVRLVAAYYTGVAVDLTIIDGVAYIAYADGGVYIVDIRGVPVLLGHVTGLAGAGAIVGISVRNGVLGVIYAGGVFVTVNVVDPANVYVLAQSWVAGVPTVVYIFRSGYAFWAVGAVVRFVDLPPVLLGAWPGSALACGSQSFGFRFSAAIDPLSVTAAALTVTQAGHPVSVTRAVSGDLVTVTPTGTLSGEVTFTMTAVANLRGTVSALSETRTFTMSPVCLGWTAHPASVVSGLSATFAFAAAGGSASDGELVVGPLGLPRTLWARRPAGASGPSFSAGWTAPEVTAATTYGAYPAVTTAAGALDGPLWTFTVFPEPCSLTPRCDDGNPCTDDACTAYVGCTYTPNDANACDDQSLCTSGDHCQGGACVPASVTTCSPATCELAHCEPSTGACQTATASDGAVCDDGDPGTAASVCQSGACVEVTGGTPLGDITVVPDPIYGTIIRRVFQVGIYAYVALEYGGLQILDVSDPAHPVTVGGWALGGGLDGCTDVVVDGDYAYLTCGGAVHVIDVRVVGNPVWVHSLDLPGATSVVVVDGALYVTVGGVLYVYTVGVYGYPAYVGTYPVASGGGTIVRVWYANGHLYTVTATGVIRVLNLTAGNVPTLAWTWYTWQLTGGSWAVTDLVVIGRYVYVSYAGGGVYAFDVSAPGSPTPVWWSGPGDVTRIAYSGGVFVYGYADGGTVTVDVSDPVNPVTLAWTYGGVGVTALQVLVSLDGVVTTFVGAGATATLVDVPPYVVGMSPHPGTAGICAQGQVDLWFSSDLAPASVDATTVAVTTAGGAPVAGDLVVVGNRVSFVPDGGALPAGDYHVAVTSGIRNVRGTAGSLDGFDADFGVATACLQWVTAPSGVERGVTGTFAWNVVGATADSGELLVSAEVQPLSPLATVETFAATPTAQGFTLAWTAPLLDANTVYYAVPRVTVGGVELYGPVVSFVVAYYGCYCAPGDHCESGLCVAQPVCDPGFDDCNGLYADGCETNIAASDPYNCGGCYVACGGGVCSGSTCQPSVLVSGAGAGIIGLTVDDDHVYWGARDSYQLLRAEKDGSNPELIVSGYYDNDVAVDDAWVYFTTYTHGTVHRAPKGGGAAELLAHSQPTPYPVTVSGNSLYYTSWSGGEVRALSLLDGGVTPVATGLPLYTGGLVVDAGTLFLSASGGEVYTQPVGGGARTTLGTTGYDIHTLDVDARYVYFGSSSALGRVRRATGEVEVFSVLGVPYGVAVDDRFVYWADYSAGTINRAAKPIEDDLGTNLLCRAGRADCDGLGANDCEVDIARDRAHCGACGVTCAADEVCTAGVCGPLTCAPERDDCDGDVLTGCEVGLRNDPAHCGGCGVVCASGVCLDGGCVAGPARESCLVHLNAGETASGYYLVDPDGAGPGAAVPVYCDQETDGGGWTVVARASDTNGWPGDYEFRAAAGAHSLVETDHTTGLADAAQYSRALDDVWAGASAEVGVQYYCYDTTDPVATAYWAKVPALDYAPLHAALSAANPDVSFAGVTAVNADGVEMPNARFDFFARGSAGIGACGNSYAGQSGIKLTCTSGQQPMVPSGVWMLTDYSGAYTEVSSCGHIGGNVLPYYAGEVRLREHRCTDGFADGEESDVDCGGPVCTPCGADSVCRDVRDCDSGVCTAGVCQAATCSDGVVNGDEEGFDCGGSCPDDCTGITWQNLVNVTEIYTTEGAGLDKVSGGNNSWDAGASSIEALDGDGYLVFTASEVNTHRMIGLGNGDSHAGYGDIDFAWYTHGGAATQIYEQGSNRGDFGPYFTGDMFRVEVMNGQVRYAHDGVGIYVSTLAPAFPLRVDTSLYEVGSTVRGAQLRPCTPVDPICVFGRAWANPYGLTGDADTLVKDPVHTGAGWSAGAISWAGFTCGKGRLSVTATETDTDRVIGLGDQDASRSYADIEYGLWLRSDGELVVVEGGVERGSFGAYAPGEVYEIDMDAPTVTYLRGGLPFYTSAVPASTMGDWVVDTAFFTPGATLTGIGLLDLDTSGDPSCGAGAFWKNVVATVRDHSAGKTGGTGASWDQGASSIPEITAGDGFVEGTIGPASTHVMFGLSNADTTPSYGDIDYAAYAAVGGMLVYESGGNVGSFGGYKTGDRLRVQLRDGRVEYRRNGVHFYTSGVVPSYPFAADVAFYEPGGRIDDVVVHTCGVDDPLCEPALDWIRGQYVSATATGLTNDIASSWNAGAITRQAITCGEGYVEARIPAISHLMFGLGAGDDSRSYGDIEHAFYPYADGHLYIYERGVQIGEFGAYAPDDVLRIEVNVAAADPYVRYLHNGVPVYTSLVRPTVIDNFHLDTSFNAAGQSIEDVALVDADAGGDPTCGGDAFWESVTNAIVRGHSAKKELGASDYDAGPISQASFSGDGYMEFTALETSTIRAAGLSNGDGGTSYTDIDYGIYLTGATVYVYEAGSYRGEFGAYDAGARFRVQVAGDVVTYSRDGVAFYTSAVTPTYPLRVDTSLYSPGATIHDVTLTACADATGACAPAPWQSGANVEVSDGGATLTRVAAAGNGWNGGASTVAFIHCGRGAVSATATETTTERMFGLSFPDTTRSYTDLDYAFYLVPGGGLQVYESGTAKWTAGTFTTGDVLTIEVDAPTVTYKKNGVAVYTSAVAASALEDYRLDTSFYHAGATLSGLTLSDLDAGDDGTCGAATFWTSVAGAVVKGVGIRKDTGVNDYDAGAISVAGLSGDGYVEFTAPETGTIRVAGLGSGDTSTSYTDIEHGIYLSGATIYANEGSATPGAYGQYQENARFRVEVKDGVVRYLRDGVPFRRAALAASFPLVVDTSLYSPNAQLRDFVLAPCDASCEPSIRWQNGRYVKAVGATGLVRDSYSSGSWLGGASSEETITCGRGRVRSVVQETTHDRMFGLGVGDASQGYEDIEYAFYLVANSALSVYQSGSLVTNVGTYQTGDRLEVEIDADAGKVYYWRNRDLPGATPLWETDLPAHFADELRLDVSLAHSGGTLGGLEIIDDDAGGDATCGGAALWSNATNAILKGSAVLKAAEAAAGWDAGATTQASFTGDGYMELVALETSTLRAAGLGTASAVTSVADMDYGIQLNGTTIDVIENNVSRGSFGTFQAGDRFRVERVGETVRYLRNGVGFYVSAVPSPSTDALVGQVALYSSGASIRDVSIHTCAGDPTCDPPIRWTNGRYVSTDAGDPTTLVRDGVGAGWYAGAISEAGIACGQGHVETTVTQVSGSRMFGLGQGDTNQDYGDIEFAIYLAGGTLEVYESGSRVVPGAGTYQVGDVLSVELDGTEVRYLKNGTPFYTSATAAHPLATYALDTSLYDATRLDDLALVETSEGATDPTCGGSAFWKNANVTTKGPSLIRESGSGWNAGASSVAQLTAAGGHVAFTPGETTTDRMIGLGHSDDGHDYTDIDFAFHLMGGGALGIYEAGANRGTFGTYAATDRLRVEVVAGQVRYRRNNVILYTSLVAPTFPLEVDTSLHSTSATVRDVLLYDLALCGNGAVDEGEGCDDGGATANDGCSASCEVEVGWSCDGAPSVCAPSATMWSCRALNDAGFTVSGVYEIDPDGAGGAAPFDVYCDQDTDGGGWTVFQRRVSGGVDFYRTWADYRDGFGAASGDYWLGNDRIAAFTALYPSALRVDMTYGGQPYYAAYGTFALGDLASGYVLYLTGFSGNAGDSLSPHANTGFSTWDSGPSAGCASTYHGAWWYTSCHSSNLNGAWGSTAYGYGLNWYSLTGYYASVTLSEMKMRELTSAVMTSCKALRAAGITVDGTYTVDPDGPGGNPAFEVWCDMTADGGGWTRVFLGANNEYSSALTYETGTPAIVGASTDMMFAYTDTTAYGLAQAWKFPTPAVFASTTPMAGPQCGYTSITATRLSDGHTATKLLRYGWGSFSDECDEGCSSTWGQICLKSNTTQGSVGGYLDFPMYSSYATSSGDHCASSTSVYTAASCTDTRRFTILVR